GCGRTDTGVHAHQYFAHFEGEFSDLDQLKYKLNKMLPQDIVIQSVFFSDLHTRFDAKRRTYKYFIRKRKDAFSHPISWVFERPMNLEAMNEASNLLLGIHDFASFAKHDSDVKTTLCEVYEIGWEETEQEYIYTVCANRFLRNMVRAMVGTFVDIGLGKINPDELMHILAQKNRSEASESVPAQGLFLWKVEY
ncbi:MAG: tRNA pseudouridine synthase A, partial [Bacteroidota bacterium]